jgi:hypothetical protein
LQFVDGKYTEIFQIKEILRVTSFNDFFNNRRSSGFEAEVKAYILSGGKLCAFHTAL